MKWWKRLREALGLQSAVERREAQRAAIEERMDAILAIPPTRIDAFVARGTDGESRRIDGPSKNGSIDASHGGSTPD